MSIRSFHCNFNRKLRVERSTHFHNKDIDFIDHRSSEFEWPIEKHYLEAYFPVIISTNVVTQLFVFVFTQEKQTDSPLFYSIAYFKLNQSEKQTAFNFRCSFGQRIAVAI